MSSFKINFDSLRNFKSSEIRPLSKVVGLYFITTNNTLIPYPFKKSKLIYIGMSEKKTNGIGARLNEHLNGQSGNMGLYNYSKNIKISFTYLNFDIIKNFWKLPIEDLESYFILDFLKNYGGYPICNNKTGFPDFSRLKKEYFIIDWCFYE